MTFIMHCKESVKLQLLIISYISQESLRSPSRRLIKESKTSPLSLVHSGRFSSHTFYLFNDIFIHSQVCVLGNILMRLCMFDFYVYASSTQYFIFFINKRLKEKFVKEQSIWNMGAYCFMSPSVCLSVHQFVNLNLVCNFFCLSTNFNLVCKFGSMQGDAFILRTHISYLKHFQKDVSLSKTLH